MCLAQAATQTLQLGVSSPETAPGVMEMGPWAHFGAASPLASPAKRSFWPCWWKWKWKTGEEYLLFIQNSVQHCVMFFVPYAGTSSRGFAAVVLVVVTFGSGANGCTGKRESWLCSQQSKFWKVSSVPKHQFWIDNTRVTCASPFSVRKCTCEF